MGGMVRGGGRFEGMRCVAVMFSDSCRGRGVCSLLYLMYCVSPCFEF